MHTIPLEIAQNIVIQAQFNAINPNQKGKDKTLAIMNQLGYIQIDTISVIERTHHHTLWVRQADYKSQYLHDLQSKDRAIFEYWGHAMSYLPMQDFRFFMNRMEKFKNPTNRWVVDFLNKSSHYLEPVKKRIQEEGPLASKDFKPVEGENKGPWWDWKPAKAALELLLWRGELMVTERKNFQKVYDLSERVLPDEINLNMPSETELAEFFIKRALRAMGLATETEIRKFLQPDAGRDSDFQALDRKILGQTIKDLMEADKIYAIHIEPLDHNKYYMLSDLRELLENPPENNEGFHILSPFDNLIIQRDRINKLFNFKYTLECYTPAPKRKYGYFSCPILWKNKLLGRLDPKADRKEKKLIIQAIYLEPDFVPENDFFMQLGQKLISLKDFNQCQQIEVKNVYPTKYKAPIKKALK